MDQSLDNKVLFHFIKENPHLVYRNGAGKLLLRNPAHIYSLLPPNQNEKSISNYSYHLSILHPEDRIPRLPLRHWFEREFAVLKKFHFHKDCDPSKLIVAFNQLSLILCFTNQLALAEKLCEEAINIFYKAYQYYQDDKMLMYVIQPWINLARLDRLRKQYARSLNRLNILINASSPNTFKHQNIIRSAINKWYTKDKNIGNVVDNCLLIDSLRCCIESPSKVFIPCNLPKETHHAKSVYSEYKIITHLKMGKYSSALNLANTVFAKGDPRRIEIFAFRRAEAVALLGGLFSARNECKKLMNYLVKKLNDTSSADLNDLNFSLAVMRFAENLGITNKTIELGIKCLEKYRLLNDELGQIFVLEILSRLDRENGSTLHINHLNNLIQKTDYLFIRNKYRLPKQNMNIKDPIFTEIKRLINFD